MHTEEDAKRIADMYATAHKEIMFTTYGHGGNEMSKDFLQLVLHMWENLKSINRTQNAMLITYEEEACRLFWSKGVPCVLDRFLPQPKDEPGGPCCLCFPPNLQNQSLERCP